VFGFVSDFSYLAPFRNANGSKSSDVKHRDHFAFLSPIKIRGGKGWAGSWIKNQVRNTEPPVGLNKLIDGLSAAAESQAIAWKFVSKTYKAKGRAAYCHCCVNLTEEVSL